MAIQKKNPITATFSKTPIPIPRNWLLQQIILYIMTPIKTKQKVNTSSQEV